MTLRQLCTGLTAIALGASDPEQLTAVEKKLDPGLTAKGLKMVARQNAGKEIRVMQSEGGVMIVETVSANGAVLPP